MKPETLYALWRRGRFTRKLPDTVQRAGRVPITIDPLEPRMPVERSLITRKDNDTHGTITDHRQP